MDLTTMTQTDLTTLQAAIRGEMARRAGEGICVARGEGAWEIPPGGALLINRPAIGGDHNTDYWYPSLEAANAALRQGWEGDRFIERKDGSLYCDYTASGCCQSEAYTTPR